MRALHAVSCLLRAFTIADAAGPSGPLPSGALACACLLQRAAASPNVAMFSTPDDVGYLEELQDVCGQERLADGTTAAACAARCGYAGATALPPAGLLASAMLLLSLHRDLCAALWTAAVAAVLGLPEPLEDTLSGAGSQCSLVQLQLEAADLLLYQRSAAAALRDHPAARSVLLAILMHASSHANTGLAVRTPLRGLRAPFYGTYIRPHKPRGRLRISTLVHGSM